jgi:nicotinamidase-related amidase
MTTGLLLIDIQNFYFSGGRTELPGSTFAASKAKELLKLFRNRHLPVMHVQHISKHKATALLAKLLRQQDFHESVRPLEGEEIVQKHHINSFRETRLEAVLKKAGIRRLVIAGMMTQMCVDAGVRAASDLGFDCIVVADACAAKPLVWEGENIPDRIVHGVILAALQGSYAKIVNVDEVERVL